jgi:hypothetical protein
MQGRISLVPAVSHMLQNKLLIHRGHATTAENRTPRENEACRFNLSLGKFAVGEEIRRTTNLGPTAIFFRKQDNVGEIDGVDKVTGLTKQVAKLREPRNI